MWAPSSFQPRTGNFCPISAPAHFRFEASLGNKSCKQGKDSRWDSFFQHHVMPQSQRLRWPSVCLNFSLGSRMKRNLHFFPDICWHVDSASLAPRYLFDLPIFIPAFDYPITLEIIWKPTRGFSLNNNPATWPSLFSCSFLFQRQNGRENKKGLKKNPHEQRCHGDGRRAFPLRLLSPGMLAALRCLSNAELLQHCWDQ